MKTLFQIKETSASSVRHCCRVLSLMLAGLTFALAVQANTYYIDLRQFGATGINVYWIQNGSSTSIMSKITIGSPEQSMIQLNDFEFSTSDAGKIKWSMAWSNGGQSEIQVPISSTHIGSHNCIKIIKTGSCNDPTKLSEYIEFTDYGSPGPTPGGDVLPVNTGSGKTRQEGNQLFLYIDGYPNAPYQQNKGLYSYENISGSPAITVLHDAAGAYLYFILENGSTSGERVYKITCTANNACAKLTFADGKTVPTVGSCSDSPTPTESGFALIGYNGAVDNHNDVTTYDKGVSYGYQFTKNGSDYYVTTTFSSAANSEILAIDNNNQKFQRNDSKSIALGGNATLKSSDTGGRGASLNNGTTGKWYTYKLQYVSDSQYSMFVYDESTTYINVTNGAATPEQTTASIKGTVTAPYVPDATAGVKVYSDAGCTSLVGTFPAAEYTSGTEFTVSVTGLTAGTTYYYKSYITNVAGTKLAASASNFTTTAAPVPGEGVLPIQGTSYNNGDQLFIYIEGFGGSSAKYKNTDTYELTVKSGNVVVNQREDTPGTLRLYYTLSSGYPMSGTNVLKLVHQESGDCAIITFDNTTYSSHKGCIEPTETPIVYWEKYPTIGNNTIDMFGYLAERWCSPVTDAGFYWKETNDITAEDIANPATNHKFLAAANPAKNNDSFSKTTPGLSEIITEPTTIYLVNYVTTAGGGTGISDVVALAYSPCFPISSVTLNSDAVSLPEGYKFTFEATARSAGKTPVYKWYLDDALIEGAASNTYEFTMPNTNPHTIKVEVTGDCKVSREATANITSCTMPAVTLAAETSTTPWTDVIITATPTAVASAEWSVEPKAELKNTRTEGATFRAGTPGTYTVKYVGASSACDATVNAEAEIEITVNADSEDCVKP